MPGLEERCKAEGDQVREAGGLFICGTERHESRRIDNQLRGRAGRQGDPGASRFFLSAQDDLVRLFAGDRIFKILDRLGPTDDSGEEYPLEAKMLSKQIENAQKKVEEQNYLSRKRVLEYDDVMNEQRRVVYKYRREVLEGRDMSDVAREQVAGVVANKVNEYTASDVFEEWDLDGLEIQLGTIWPVSVDLAELDPQTSSREQVTEILTEDALAAYDEREEEFGEELMRALERHILLQIIDIRWKEHLAEMDYMREGIHLRGFAQIDPLVAYKNEGYIMFQALMDSLWEEFARLIFHVDVQIEPNQVDEAFGADEEPTDVDYSGGTEEGQPSALAEARAAPPAPATAPAAGAAVADTGERCPQRWHQPGHGRQGRGREDRPQRPLLVRLAARNTRSATAPERARGASHLVVIAGSRHGRLRRRRSSSI